MTENKRFELACTNNKGWVVLDRVNILWRKEIIRLLNELHEENEELKQENKALKVKLHKIQIITKGY